MNLNYLRNAEDAIIDGIKFKSRHYSQCTGGLDEDARNYEGFLLIVTANWIKNVCTVSALRVCLHNTGKNAGSFFLYFESVMSIKVLSNCGVGVPQPTRNAFWSRAIFYKLSGVRVSERMSV